MTEASVRVVSIADDNRVQIVSSKATDGLSG